MTANLRFGAGYATPRPDTVLRLRRVRRHRRRGRDVQRRRRLPQDARGHDVPVVHGDARRAAHDARPRQRAAARNDRPAGRGRARRPGRLRDARPVPRMPRLQGRVSRSAWTWRASRASSSPATGSATARRSRRGRSATRAALARLRQRLRAALELVARQRAGAGDLTERLLGIDRRRRLPAFQRRTFDRRAGAAGAARRAAPTAVALRRHVHELLRPRDRHGGARGAGRGRRAGGAGAATAAAAGRRSRRGCSTTRRRSPRRNADRLYDDGRRRAPDRLLRAELPVGGARGRARTARAARRGARPRWWPAPACCSRSTSPRSAGARCRSRPARPACCFTATATSDRWGSCRRRKRCCRGSRASTVVDAEAGCCGMAGSFGYGRDHYEVSRAIGERRLFPAVRARGEGTVVVAAGTSCRHQIHDFTGAEAVHPAVLLRSLLLGRVPYMNLAWLSLGALVRRDDRELRVRDERRRPRAGAGVAGRRLRRRPRPQRRARRLSGAALSHARRRHADVHAGAVERHARPRGARGRPRLSRQRRLDSGDVLRAGVR